MTRAAMREEIALWCRSTVILAILLVVRNSDAYKDIVYCVRCIYKLVASSYVVVMQQRFLACRTYVA